MNPKWFFRCHLVLLVFLMARLLPHPLSFDWPLLLTAIGALLVVPWVIHLLPESGQGWLLPAGIAGPSGWIMLAAAASLLGSFGIGPSAVSGSLAVPWFAFAAYFGIATLWSWRKHRRGCLGSLAMAVGCLQFSIGAAWLLADRFAWRPMGFDPVIVRLTAAHFHFAGFLLPIVAGWTLLEIPRPWMRFSVMLVLAGVPLVAIGITCTKLGAPVAIESSLALVFAAGVLGVAAGIGKCGWNRRNPWLLLSGMSLAVGMLFAGAYALSFLLHFSLSVLQIPFMWAIHGSVQVFGFGILGLTGWQRHWRSA